MEENILPWPTMEGKWAGKSDLQDRQGYGKIWLKNGRYGKDIERYIIYLRINIIIQGQPKLTEPLDLK